MQRTGTGSMAGIDANSARRVLIIHGDTEVRCELEECLVTSGWQVFLAEGRADGLRLMYRVQPDLIFLEIAADREESWDLFFSIRLLTDCPIVLLADRLLAPSYRPLANYNALMLFNPVSPTAAAAIAEALEQAPPSFAASDVATE